MIPLLATLRVTVVSGSAGGSSSTTSHGSPRRANRWAGVSIPMAWWGRTLLYSAAQSSRAAWAAAMLVRTRLARNSIRSVRWNRSILPVVVGERTPVRRWVMPFWRQTRSKSTSTGLGE